MGDAPTTKSYPQQGYCSRSHHFGPVGAQCIAATKERCLQLLGPPRDGVPPYHDPFVLKNGKSLCVFCGTEYESSDKERDRHERSRKHWRNVMTRALSKQAPDAKDHDKWAIDRGLACPLGCGRFLNFRDRCIDDHLNKGKHDKEIVIQALNRDHWIFDRKYRLKQEGNVLKIVFPSSGSTSVTEYKPTHPPEPLPIRDAPIAKARTIAHPSLDMRVNTSTYFPTFTPSGTIPQPNKNGNLYHPYTPPTFDRIGTRGLHPNFAVVPPPRNVGHPLLTRPPPGTYVPARGPIPHPPNINPGAPHRISIFNGPPVPSLSPQGSGQYVHLFPSTFTPWGAHSTTSLGPGKSRFG